MTEKVRFVHFPSEYIDGLMATEVMLLGFLLATISPFVIVDTLKPSTSFIKIVNWLVGAIEGAF